MTLNAVVFPEIADPIVNTLGFSVVFCILVPIGVSIYAFFKLKKTVIPFLFGIFLYFFVQVIPVTMLGNMLLGMLGMSEAYAAGETTATLVLTAFVAIVEEVFRYICFAYMMQNFLNRQQSLMFGLSYGFSGMILEGAVVSLNSLIVCTAINSGAVTSMDAATQANFALLGEKTAAISPVANFLVSFDQSCLVLMSMALAYFLAEAVKAKNNKLLIVPIAVRLMAKCGSIMLRSAWTWGFVSATLFLVIIAGISIWYLVKTKTPDPSKPNFNTI